MYPNISQDVSKPNQAGYALRREHARAAEGFHVTIDDIILGEGMTC